MILAHVIALDPTAAQEEHFRKACGVARLAYNWALAEWKRKYEAGERPSAYKLKIKWNEIRRSQFPFTLEVTKCAGSQAILNLGVAFGNFFRDLKKPKGVRKARYPRFKKKGVHDSFSLWNDQFAIDGTRIRIPNLGWVRLTEPLRIAGKIMGAVVKRECDRWFVSVQVEVPDPVHRPRRVGASSKGHLQVVSPRSTICGGWASSLFCLADLLFSSPPADGRPSMHETVLQSFGVVGIEVGLL